MMKEMTERQKYRVIGMMSGTSMDGLDIVDVEIGQISREKWTFRLISAKLYKYDKNHLSKLQKAFHYSAEEMTKFSADLGRYYAQKVNQFIEEKNIDKNQLDFIASHGQTIFHQPQQQYTLQIGNGPELAIETQLPTITDFRTKDVALGGTGAPLIPVADFLLFSEYADTFLNLGGFSNLSFKKNEKVFSYDVCPVNIVINHLIKEIGLEYDKNGDVGSKGDINLTLLSQLNELPFYSQNGPKSLGWEWVVENILPLLKQETILENKIRTFYEHIAIQIGSILNSINSSSVLITGGGAKNSFLIQRIRENTNCKVVIPKESIIDFKEAIGFAFLGVLRWQNKINVWSSVTGSKQDSSSGIITLP